MTKNDLCKRSTSLPQQKVIVTPARGIASIQYWIAYSPAQKAAMATVMVGEALVRWRPDGVCWLIQYRTLMARLPAPDNNPSVTEITPAAASALPAS